MGWNAAWSMAVGGMVGGGIFSVLGVVVSLAGSWAWLSFVLAGAIALATAHSYSRLAARFGEEGGAFTFLREIDLEGFAGSLSWILVVGYVLTLSVYAFTFGHYLGAIFGLGGWFFRVAAVSIVAALVWVNLMGVGESAGVEVFTVWGKLAILLVLAVVGLVRFRPEAIAYHGQGGWDGALIGAASIFMAYEGFQLLSYDYDDIENPSRTLPLSTMTAVAAVIVVYVLVTLGATSLVGAASIVQHEEIALARAGQAAAGAAGLIVVSVAAAFSTASAINATLFATARLSRRVAADGELPGFLDQENARGVPALAVGLLGAAGATLALVGSLSSLVSAASLAFLFTFCTVNVLAATTLEERRWVGWSGAAGAAAAALGLTWRLAGTNPGALIALAGLAAVAIFARPWILRHTVTRGGSG